MQRTLPIYLYFNIMIMKNKMLLISGAVTVATLATTSVFADF